MWNDTKFFNFMNDETIAHLFNVSEYSGIDIVKKVGNENTLIKILPINKIVNTTSSETTTNNNPPVFDEAKFDRMINMQNDVYDKTSNDLNGITNSALCPQILYNKYNIGNYIRFCGSSEPNKNTIVITTKNNTDNVDENILTGGGFFTKNTNKYVVKENNEDEIRINISNTLRTNLVELLNSKFQQYAIIVMKLNFSSIRQIKKEKEKETLLCGLLFENTRMMNAGYFICTKKCSSYLVANVNRHLHSGNDERYINTIDHKILFTDFTCCISFSEIVIETEVNKKGDLKTYISELFNTDEKIKICSKTNPNTVCFRLDSEPEKYKSLYKIINGTYLIENKNINGDFIPTNLTNFDVANTICIHIFKSIKQSSQQTKVPSPNIIEKTKEFGKEIQNFFGLKGGKQSKKRKNKRRKHTRKRKNI